jgi:hypothetical protein
LLNVNFTVLSALSFIASIMLCGISMYCFCCGMIIISVCASPSITTSPAWVGFAASLTAIRSLLPLVVETMVMVLPCSPCI